jgi:catechol 2,3-dioxygenase-like lactoylglutathione lyase family enzyme
LGCPVVAAASRRPAALSELPDQRNSGRLMLRSINHISKVCSNVEASVAFYREVLGFILIKRPTTFNNTFEGAWLWGYGMGLHLIKGTPVPRSKQIDPKSDHLSFQVRRRAAAAPRGMPCTNTELCHALLAQPPLLIPALRCVCLQADSLDEVEAQLRARGVPYCRQTVVEDGLEVNQCFFLDCDNNMIEVGCLLLRGGCLHGVGKRWGTSVGKCAICSCLPSAQCNLLLSPFPDCFC